MISEETKEKIRSQAGHRCGYCLSPQRLVLGRLEIEHIVPSAKGGSDDEPNLWLACRMCNNFKGEQTEGIDPITEERVPLFNPRSQKWAEHMAWTADGKQILGLTPIGRATVIALQLNNCIAVLVREQWQAAGWHPPSVVS